MKLFEMIQQIGSRAGTRAATAARRFFKGSLSHIHSLNIGTPDRHPPHKGPSFIPERRTVHLFSTCVCYKRIKKADAQLIFRPATTTHSCQVKMQPKSAVKIIVGSHST
jgi:hypothetical protein